MEGNENLVFKDAYNAFLEQDPVLMRVNFLTDVLSKFHKNMDLSERQIQAVEKVWTDVKARAIEDSEPKGPAPEGSQTMIAKILFDTWKEGRFGRQHKMMVRFQNRSKCWLTVPRNLQDQLKGMVIELTATFTVAKDDITFCFASKPSAITVHSDKFVLDEISIITE